EHLRLGPQALGHHRIAGHPRTLVNACVQRAKILCKNPLHWRNAGSGPPPPVLVRSLGRLRHLGPTTATILGELLGESSGATSYHLRVLAANGFVAEEPGRGTGPERCS